MNRTTKYPRCSTLRLTTALDDGLDSLAYDLGVSRAETVRRLLARAIAASVQYPSNFEFPEATR